MTETELQKRTEQEHGKMRTRASISLINSLNENVKHIGKLMSGSIKTAHIIICCNEKYLSGDV